ncbi:hypothetical protein ABIF00_001828 [Bradyrhizobium elkanii]
MSGGYRLLLGADRSQRACDRDVVDVVAGGVRQRAFLAPAGHASIDQPGIAREHDVRTEPEALHHAGPKTFDQRVGMAEQVEHFGNRRLVLEIELDDLAAAGCDRLQILARTDPVQRDHLGAHVGEQHAGERAGADAGEFDDAEAGERARGASGGLGGRFIEHVVIPLVAWR